MSTEPVILGLNCVYHESAVCLLAGGQLLAFAEEERFNRRKHAKPARIDNADELPYAAIQYCLAESGLRWADVDCVAVPFDPDLRTEPIEESVTVGSWGHPDGEREFLQRVRAIPRRLSELAAMDVSDRVRWVPHEFAHAASAYYPSGYSQAAVLSLDGIAESSTGLLAYGEGTKLEDLGWLRYPTSIGFVWEKLSKFVGLGEYDAAKVMALAAFASPERFRAPMRALFRDAAGRLAMTTDRLRFRAEDYGPLEELFGPRRLPGGRIDTRDAQVAAALQEATEQAIFDLCTELAERTGAANLCLAGGVVLNCVANGQLAEHGPFRSIFVQPLAHDAGTSLGAALYVNHHLYKGETRYEMTTPYLGSDYSDTEMEAALREEGLAFARLDDAPRTVAALIAESRIGGWFQGRAEVGPRALGNRSILADPRRPGSKELINLRIKHREYFRPFAPSVLIEATDEWFEIHGESRSHQYMSFAFRVRPERRAAVPAILHVDGTSRLQAISAETNPRFHALVREFERLTGIPLVLNTSFNTFDEPIVHSPRDAVRTYQRTGMDFLAMGDFLTTRNLS